VASANRVNTPATTLRNLPVTIFPRIPGECRAAHEVRRSVSALVATCVVRTFRAPNWKGGCDLPANAGKTGNSQT